ncbi:MAG: class A beta-lactamase-related serine hydrolase [Patescibacteria group bacterium]|nr:class A beta-lactamase-related serine hydrolase [Patescibacteria group bacterium]
MFFFGKANRNKNKLKKQIDIKSDSEADDSEESKSQGFKKGKPVKVKDPDFKDLNPQNKKKRREPKKEWGTKERIIVMTALFVTAGLSAIFALHSRSWKLANAPRVQPPDISVPFVSEETIVLDSRKKDKQKADEIISEIKKITKRLNGVYGVYVINLKSGFSFGVNHTEEFQAASLMKLPVMAAMYLESEQGRLSLDEKYTLAQSDKTGGSGSLVGRPVGYQITYRNLISAMGKQSDNTAYTIGIKTIGITKIKEMITKSGMKNTNFDKNMTTPEDVGIFFENLWKGNILNKKNKEEMLSFLTDTIYEAWIPAGLPEDIKSSHKYGREVHVVNDAGIVYANTPYIVVIMSKGIVDREADTAIPEISRVVYEMMSNG